jgi:hypothetical protein
LPSTCPDISTFSDNSEEALANCNIDNVFIIIWVVPNLPLEEGRLILIIWISVFMWLSFVVNCVVLWHNHHIPGTYWDKLNFSFFKIRFQWAFCVRVLFVASISISCFPQLFLLIKHVWCILKTENLFRMEFFLIISFDVGDCCFIEFLLFSFT